MQFPPWVKRRSLRSALGADGSSSVPENSTERAAFSNFVLNGSRFTVAHQLRVMVYCPYYNHKTDSIGVSVSATQGYLRHATQSPKH